MTSQTTTKATDAAQSVIDPATDPRKDVPIVAVEVSGSIEDMGAEAAKALPPGRRYRYSQRITYTLDNGRRLESRVCGRTKPKLASELDFYRRMISKQSLKACLREPGGEMWGTSTAFGL